MRSRFVQGGFTYLALLLAVAILGLGLTIAAPIWSRLADRERMQQLDWVGGEFVRAIGSYYDGTPGVVVKTYPPSLQSLLLDSRFVMVRRHLRRIYANPFTGRGDWVQVLAPQGGVRGVRVTVFVDDRAVIREYDFDPSLRR